MNQWLNIYRAATYPLGIAADAIYGLAGSRLKDTAAWKQRMGDIHVQNRDAAHVDLWMHGASVGEILVVQAIAEKLLDIQPDARLAVSAFTPAGLQRAREIFSSNIPVFASPLDLPGPVCSATKAIKPKIYCCVETELWPNLLHCLHSRGTRLILANARISDRSFPSYRRLKFLFSPVLNMFQHICAVSEASMQRLVDMGADPERMEVTGNAKFEYLLNLPDELQAARMGQDLGLPEDRPVIVAGSIRGTEYKAVIEAMSALEARGRNRPFLVLAPRHIKRVDEIGQFLEQKRIKFTLFSDAMKHEKALNGLDCMIVDKMGQLFNLYGLCHMAFVGGSLEPFGGQNLMEPAAWGRPVVFGQNVANFQDAANALLNHGGGIMVKGTAELAQAMEKTIYQDKTADEAGRRARQALKAISGGAATLQAKRIASYL